MDTGGKSVPQIVASQFSARPRGYSEGVDHNFPTQNVQRPDMFYTEQNTARPGLSRAHASYSGTPNPPFSASLYPAHLRSLAPSSYQQPHTAEQNRTAPAYASSIQVNRVTTLPNPLSRGYANHPGYQQQSSQTPPPQFASYAGPPPFEFIPAPITRIPPNHGSQPVVIEKPNLQYQEASPPQSPSLQYRIPVEHVSFGDPSPLPNQSRIPEEVEEHEEEDVDGLALAIELSQKMVLEQQQMEEKLRRQEEDEFERALAQSMLETSSYYPPDPSYGFEEGRAATSSRITLDTPRQEDNSAFRHETFGSSSSMVGSSSEPYAQTQTGRYPEPPTPTAEIPHGIAAGKQLALPNNSTTISPPHDTAIVQQDVSSHCSSPATDSDQQAMLFQEEPEKVFRDKQLGLANSSSNDGTSRSPSPLHILTTQDFGEGSPDGKQSNPTLYGETLPPIIAEISTELVGLPPLNRADSPSELAYYDEVSPRTPVPTQSCPPEYVPPEYVLQTMHDGHSTYSNPRGGISYTSRRDSPQFSDTTPDHPAPKPINTTAFSHHHQQGIYSPPILPAQHYYGTATHSTSISSSPQNFSSPLQEFSDSPLERVSSSSSVNSYQNNSMSSASTLPPGAAPAVPQVVAANQYIDPDLLLGVSIDFKEPVLSAQLMPMAGAVPNIVSLPYGRCLPLHIQAPSWKHLLKLLARMGNTKFEPTQTAKAALKSSDMKLRTVVQFVKIHPMSDDWRTILWFTIDHPVPPSLPNAHKWANPNPSLLPWSYELINPPRLLRNSSDFNMSKTYTIPTMDALPYPTIPLSFPNLALYLQAALDFSRRQKDDSNGYRQLAKMVQTCYPYMEDNSDETPEKKTVGGLFKRVIGRNNKKRGKTNNEETYEYITPFVPDEWG